eukprot:9048-Prorocentrum_minimum.AAC.2
MAPGSISGGLSNTLTDSATSPFSVNLHAFVSRLVSTCKAAPTLSARAPPRRGGGRAPQKGGLGGSIDQV